MLSIGTYLKNFYSIVSSVGWQDQFSFLISADLQIHSSLLSNCSAVLFRRVVAWPQLVHANNPNRKNIILVMGRYFADAK
tara:strand:- start:1342 stop:1581 length:240 start_codon:yes stop_codon:yes gene_type:complete